MNIIHAFFDQDEQFLVMDVVADIQLVGCAERFYISVIILITKIALLLKCLFSQQLKILSYSRFY